MTPAPNVPDMLTYARQSVRDAAATSTTFLPDPEPARRDFLVISVDDHLVEPPGLFDGRLPEKYQDRAPRVVERDDGSEAWVYEGEEISNVGMNAVVGRPPSEWSMEPTRFDQMRRGAWDVHERVRDMDLNGVYASLNFPSFLPGFVGQRLQLGREEGFARALVQAYNSWHLEDWHGPFPERIIPCQVPYLLDPEVAGEEVRQNAERGFAAVTFSEAPDKFGLPSIHSSHWDPFFRACEETGTVVAIHIGSSGTSPTLSEGAPGDATTVLFGLVAAYTAVDWLFSPVPMRFPDLKICLAEGGIGWVPALLDRLDHSTGYLKELFPTWADTALTPAEVLLRNFWFCALDDPTAYRILDRIGAENVLVEVDYPHVDGTWPRTQELLARDLAGLSSEDIERVTWRNAAQLFKVQVPTEVIADRTRFGQPS